MKKSYEESLINYATELLERYETALNIINNDSEQKIKEGSNDREFYEYKIDRNNSTIKELKFVIEELKK